jgi:hypothetical protein
MKWDERAPLEELDKVRGNSVAKTPIGISVVTVKIMIKQMNGVHSKDFNSLHFIWSCCIFYIK